MTTMELNAELYRAMSEIADDRDSLEKVLAFVKSLVPSKKKRRKSSNERLDDALAKFSGDWGGDKTPEEIAEELREGVANDRMVEAW